MDSLSSKQSTTESLQTLKRLAATVYLCQILTFMLAGFPLLAGVAINFYKRNDVEGTWLESHFDWQIKTAWVAIAGFAISGITFGIGVGIFVLTVTVLWLLYRIAVGWFALTDGRSINEEID